MSYFLLNDYNQLYKVIFFLRNIQIFVYLQSKN